MPFGIAHEIIKGLARWSLWAFYKDIIVIDESDLPIEIPVVACCTHANMMIDPAILACTFPNGRQVHYWAKDSIFKNKIGAKILYNAGVIPVDRKTKDNQKLYKGTFVALKAKECVGIFPEGTSSHSPTMTAFKDGASFAALEFAKQCISDSSSITSPSQDKLCAIVPVAITYVEKWKYRSKVIVYFGKPLYASDYIDAFLQAPKETAKRLTADTYARMRELSINADEWDDLYASEMARELLFRDGRGLQLLDPKEYISVTQHFINLFARADSKDIQSLKTLLVAHHASLERNGLVNTDLFRIRTSEPSLVWQRILTTIAALGIRFPFVAPVLLLHAHIYWIARLAIKSEKYKESFAQNKIVGSLIGAILTYISFFFLIWAFFVRTAPGVFIAFGVTLMLAVYHVEMIDGTYSHFKTLLAGIKVGSMARAAEGKEQLDHLLEAQASGRELITRVLKESSNDHDASAIYNIYRKKI